MGEEQVRVAAAIKRADGTIEEVDVVAVTFGDRVEVAFPPGTSLSFEAGDELHVLGGASAENPRDRVARA